ncbi:MAG TPA: ABC transporter permease [Gemmatimonadaceae bacterium]|nr:ABC transporter permease [Gemmatimonadaceae bacterium]
MKGLGLLTWLELKIFMREPLGAIGTILIPVGLFVLLGKATSGEHAAPSEPFAGLLGPGGVPTLLALSVTVGAVLSLANIISIYREGGILKRLRATPLRPWTILTAHVLVKLFLTALTMTLMILAGRRYFPIGSGVPLVGFTVAVVISTLAILAMGFILASVIPTARFAQPIGALIFWPMIGLCGLFVAISALPPTLRAIASVLPLRFSASLMQGIWIGDRWSAHLMDISALAIVFVVCVAISAKVFRWE